MNIQKPKAGWGGNLHSDFNLASGNIDLRTWGVGGALNYLTVYKEPDIFKSALEIRVEHFQGLNSGMFFADSLFASLSYAYMLDKIYGLFGYVQLETNEFQALTHRTTTGLGLMVRFYSSQNWQIWTALSPMFEKREEFCRG